MRRLRATLPHVLLPLLHGSGVAQQQIHGAAMTGLALLSGLGHAVLVAASLLLYVLATRIGHQHRHPPWPGCWGWWRSLT